MEQDTGRRRSRAEEWIYRRVVQGLPADLRDYPGGPPAADHHDPQVTPPAGADVGVAGGPAEDELVPVGADFLRRLCRGEERAAAAPEPAGWQRPPAPPPAPEADGGELRTPDKERRIELAFARIDGPLDLSTSFLVHPLVFSRCVFVDEVNLTDARGCGPIELTHCTVPALHADRLRVASWVDLAWLLCPTRVSLAGAQIEGVLRLTGSRLTGRSNGAGGQPSTGSWGTPPADRAGLTGGQVLDLSAAVVRDTLFLDAVEVHGAVLLKSAHLFHDLDCRRSRFYGEIGGKAIDAELLTLGGDLLCQDGFHSRGEVCLKWSQLHTCHFRSGTLVNRHDWASHAYPGPNTRALHLDGMRADDIYLDGATFHGEVRMVGADITGELCCTGATFDNGGAVALEAERLHATDVYLNRETRPEYAKPFHAEGEVRLCGAEIGRQLTCTDGEFHNQGQRAIDASGITCSGIVFLDGDFDAQGEVRLHGASITRELNCTNGSFANGHGIALDADGMTTEGNVFLDADDTRGRHVKGFQAEGTVRLARATVGRQLICRGGTFRGRQIRGGGTVTEAEEDLALDLSGLICHGDVILDAAHAGAEVRVQGASIDRDLRFDGAELSGESPFALRAQCARVEGNFRWKPTLSDRGQRHGGRIDLSFAEVGRLCDDASTGWPRVLHKNRRLLRRYPDNGINLDGFAYRCIGDPDEGTTGGLDADRAARRARRRAHRCKEKEKQNRLDLLAGATPYSASAYQQLADWYRRSGDGKNARDVAVEKHRQMSLRGCLHWYSRLWNWILWLTVGYGYRLWRLLLIILLLGGFSAYIYHQAEHSGKMLPTDQQTAEEYEKQLARAGGSGSPAANVNCPESYPCFNAGAYALQLLIPGVNLRVLDYWMPNARSAHGFALTVYTWVLVVLGWLFGFALVSGINRAIRRE